MGLWYLLRLFTNILVLLWGMVGFHLPDPVKFRHGCVTCYGQ